MRLLYVSHSLPPHGRPLDNVGGMQRVAIDLHDSLLAHRDVSVTPLVLRSPWIQRHYRTPVFLAQAGREIARLARAKEIDAVLFSSLVTASLAVPLKGVLRRNRVLAAAIVYGLDATLPSLPYQRWVPRVLASLDLVLPISNATAQACRDRGLQDEKCEVVLLGIRLDRFVPPPDRAAARAKLLEMAGLPASTQLVLTSTGRLVPRKGVAWFIRNVMPLLPADVAYVVAGEGEDRPSVESAVHAHGLADRVKLLGRVTEPELEAVYQGADLFLMPNVQVAGDMEGFGLVLLEAGLCGLPAIASRLEGIADVVTEGANGHLVESGDAEGFREAIMAYYPNPELLAEAAQRARLHTASRFGWTGVTDRYVELIAERVRAMRP